MRALTKMTVFLGTLAFVLAGPSLKTAQAQAPSSEATHQSSDMAPGTGNNGAANNGVGTDGSLDHDHGKASSTVAGMGGAKAGVGGDSSKATSGPVESDPGLGGSKKPE